MEHAVVIPTFTQDRCPFLFLVYVDGYIYCFFSFHISCLFSFLGLFISWILSSQLFSHELELWHINLPHFSILEIPFCCCFSRNRKSDGKTECPYESRLCVPLRNTCFSLLVNETWINGEVSWVTIVWKVTPVFLVPVLWIQSKTDIILP